MCGIVGLILEDPEHECDAAAQLHEALYTLQHRGQDACGIATCASGGKIFQRKGSGRAEGVFKNGTLLRNLPGYMGVGHLRYPTAGSNSLSESQPIYVNSPYGIVLSHNGNLTNSVELKRYLDLEAHRHINSDSDSELILNVFADELNTFRKARVNRDDLVSALRSTYARLEGAWACVAMLAGHSILGFRDPWGIRPLCIGKRGDDYMMASESPALKQLGFEFIRDIRPGECVIIERGGSPSYFQVEEQKAYKVDAFEYIYFSRPDSIIDGISVYTARKNMGVALAKTIKSQLSETELAEIDAIVPVPETAITAAISCSNALEKPYADGFVKSRYIFRTFLIAGQKNRESSVRRKLAPIATEFTGKNLIILDDSLVRGTTSREIVSLAKGAGAKKIYFASAVKAQHVFGIDLASQSELIAHERNDGAIAKHLGVEKVIYQTLDDLTEACVKAGTIENGPIDLEVGVFSGEYCMPIEADYFKHLDKLRGEKNKQKKLQDAREAVANGITDPSQQQLMTNGQKIITAQASFNTEGPSKAGPTITPGDHMDISLHNFGDHE